MKPTPTALALVLATSAMAYAAPAAAQYGSSVPTPVIRVPPPAVPATEPATAAYSPKVSPKASKEIQDLQTAVNAKDVANIPAKLAAAQAKMKTKEDKYVVARLHLTAAADAKDAVGMAAAIDAVVASGARPASEAFPFYNALGQTQFNAKDYAGASNAFERVLRLDPNNLDAMVMMAETRHAQGKTADGIVFIQKAITTRTAAGQKADESWYKWAISKSYSAKLATTSDLARAWLVAYPSPKSWRDSIIIYQIASKLDDSALLDSMRLAQAVGALAGENDYFRFTNTLVNKGFPGEAKLALEQGFAAKSIDKAKPTFALLYTAASTKSQGDRASLAGSGKAALAAPAAKQAMLIGDAYYGYGDYTQAADLYRAALTKTGADKDLVNLRLGMALARSGNKAGATAALNAAGGAQIEVAKLWLAYVATRA